jgi:methylthioribose-1-phosphate isomerase
MTTMSTTPATLHWEGGIDGRLVMIDQTLLPVEFKEIDCPDVETVWEAIKALRVRGAPAIGVSTGYGVCVGLQTVIGQSDEAIFARLKEVCEYLATSRPTAVNLFWALDRMQAFGLELQGQVTGDDILERLLDEAKLIEKEDREMCRAIGRHGQMLLADGQGVLTHCNAGGLATTDYGTALAVFFAAQEAGKTLHIYADETRPLLQGSRLTAWELMQRDIDVTVICDNMAAQVMKEGRVQAVVVGADRVAANGDACNKIGTYGVALLAAAHDIPFYVAAPSSTFDFATPTGDEIPIEIRDPVEVTHGFGNQTAPDGVQVYSPAFDVTPARLVKAFITEKGIIEAPYIETLAANLKTS